MLQYIKKLFFLCLAWTGTMYGYQSDFITYDWIGDMSETTGGMDHVPHWRRLFNTMRVRGFLECGVGYPTSYFLDNAGKVVSVEYLNRGYGDDWYQVFLSLYSDRPNWIPMTYNENNRSNSFHNACAYQCSTHQDYSLIDPTYVEELDAHFKQLLSDAKAGGYDIDVAFVDPGVYLKGDLVKLLLKNEVPVVAAHNTSSDKGIYETDDLYGWNKVVTPFNYVKIYIPIGHGTTFWINENYPLAIASMISYRDKVVARQQAGLDLSFEGITQLADMGTFLPKS